MLEQMSRWVMACLFNVFGKDSEDLRVDKYRHEASRTQDLVHARFRQGCVQDIKKC